LAKSICGAGAFPVRAGDRVDRTRERHGDVHRGADPERASRVGSPAGGLADHLGPAKRLQRVAEVLAPGEGPAAGQHVDRPVEVAGAGDVGQRPELPGLTGPGMEDVVEMSRLLVEQVAAPEDHALRHPASVAPQVDDERIGSGDELHRGGDGRARERRNGHPAQVEIADVAAQALDPVDAEVVQPPHPPHRELPGLVVAGFGQAVLLAVLLRTGARSGTAARQHPQVPVGADLLEVAGEQLGEDDLVQVVVLAGRHPRLDRRGGLVGALGEHVMLPQQREGGGHDLAARRRLVSRRAVVRHHDPRGGGAGVVEGELEQRGRRQPRDSSRRSVSIPRWWAVCHAARACS
jgi:hypothetical protein